MKFVEAFITSLSWSVFTMIVGAAFHNWTFNEVVFTLASGIFVGSIAMWIQGYSK